jgi:hypothetical protein
MDKWLKDWVEQKSIEIDTFEIVQRFGMEQLYLSELKNYEVKKTI